MFRRWRGCQMSSPKGHGHGCLARELRSQAQPPVFQDTSAPSGHNESRGQARKDEEAT